MAICRLVRPEVKMSRGEITGAQQMRLRKRFRLSVACCRLLNLSATSDARNTAITDAFRDVSCASRLVPRGRCVSIGDEGGRGSGPFRNLVKVLCESSCPCQRFSGSYLVFVQYKAKDECINLHMGGGRRIRKQMCSVNGTRCDTVRYRVFHTS